MTYVARNSLHAVLVRAMIQQNTCTGYAPQPCLHVLPALTSGVLQAVGLHV